MISLTVTGMFKELKSGHKVPPTRFFFRTMVIVPAGSGFCIANETLHVTNATEEQAKVCGNYFFFLTYLFMRYFLSVQVAFRNQVISPSTTPVSSPAVQRVLDDATKQQMLQAMSDQSGMNLEWSGKYVYFIFL